MKNKDLVLLVICLLLIIFFLSMSINQMHENNAAKQKTLNSLVEKARGTVLTPDEFAQLPVEEKLNILYSRELDNK